MAVGLEFVVGGVSGKKIASLLLLSIYLAQIPRCPPAHTLCHISCIYYNYRAWIQTNADDITIFLSLLFFFPLVTPIVPSVTNPVDPLDANNRSVSPVNGISAVMIP